MLWLEVGKRQGVQLQLLEKVCLALIESPAVLKLYKYVFDIQRLVDPPIWKLLSRGEWKMRMWEASAHKPLLFRVVCHMGPKGIKPTGVSEGWVR